MTDQTSVTLQTPPQTFHPLSDLSQEVQAVPSAEDRQTDSRDEGILPHYDSFMRVIRR